MGEISDFVYSEAMRRGIDGGTALRVARSEGGTDDDDPARRGTFDTGSSWWPFQLHYGGAGYEYLGYVAGMGNRFTEVTGWEPGDPAAWKDSVRWALNQVQVLGWSPWYGAAAVGIGKWQGIDRTHGPVQDQWDYVEGKPVPSGLRRVAVNGLRLRGEAGLGAHVVNSFMEGDGVRQLGDDPIDKDGYHWVRVTGCFGGIPVVGWVASEYLD